MTDRPGAPPSVRRLTADLVGSPGVDPALAGLPAWLAASPGFRAFAEANRDKIRKKLRGATETEARLDVRAELRVAALLLADRRFDLTFEAYGAKHGGPDFTVTFRAGRPFNVEVTRRRPGPGAASLEPSILAKLRQLPPSMSNVLVVAVDERDRAPDPAPTLRDLRARADRHDDGFFATRGLDDAAAFNARARRLAVVVTWSDSVIGPARVASSANAGARIPLPAPTLRALLAALAAE